MKIFSSHHQWMWMPQWLAFKTKFHKYARYWSSLYNVGTWRRSLRSIYLLDYRCTNLFLKNFTLIQYLPMEIKPSINLRRPWVIHLIFANRITLWPSVDNNIPLNKSEVINGFLKPNCLFNNLYHCHVLCPIVDEVTVDCNIDLEITSLKPSNHIPNHSIMLIQITCKIKIHVIYILTIILIVFKFQTNIHSTWIYIRIHFTICQCPFQNCICTLTLSFIHTIVYIKLLITLTYETQAIYSYSSLLHGDNSKINLSEGPIA